MPRALNREKYAQLVAKALPRMIHDDRELAELTHVLFELDSIEKPSREQKELADLLTNLIEQYEAENYAVPRATPIEVVRFLLDQRGLTPKDLWPVIGSRGVTSEILNGKRAISTGIATKLGHFFEIEPALFIEWKTERAGGDSRAVS